MKSLFNWLAEKPARQWTLGEAVFGEGFGYELPRGARIAERALTLGGIFGAVASVALGGPAGIPLAIDFLVGGKAFGLIAAAITKITVGAIDNHNKSEDAKVQEMGELMKSAYVAGLGKEGAAKMGFKIK